MTARPARQTGRWRNNGESTGVTRALGVTKALATTAQSQSISNGGERHRIGGLRRSELNLLLGTSSLGSFRDDGLRRLPCLSRFLRVFALEACGEPNMEKRKHSTHRVMVYSTQVAAPYGLHILPPLMRLEGHSEGRSSLNRVCAAPPPAGGASPALAGRAVAAAAAGPPTADHRLCS